MSHRLAYLLAAATFAVCVFASAASAFGPLSSIGARGEAAGQFGQVNGLAVAGDGTIYVSDVRNSRIDVFDAHGAFLFAFGKEVAPNGADLCTTASSCKAGAQGGSAGAMSQPSGLLIAPSGHIYVADAANSRIDVFDAHGAFLFTFGKEVNANGQDICAAGSTCQRGTFGPARFQAGGMFEPTGLGLDSSGNLYVADEQNGRIDVFSQDGAFLRAFGFEVNPQPSPANPNLCTTGSGCRSGRRIDAAGAFQNPFDVKVASSGQIVVSDIVNRRIDVYSADDEFLYAFGKEVARRALQIGTFARS